MPRGIAKNPATDKRRLPRQKTGGIQKTGRRKRTFFVDDAEWIELTAYLLRLRQEKNAQH